MRFRIIIILCLFTFLYGCKKDYGWDVQYKVKITPFAGQTSFITNVEYLTKDNVLKRETITSTTWEFSFKAAEDDNVYLKAFNSSNASSLRIEMITNGVTYSDECNLNGCSVELKRSL